MEKELLNTFDKELLLKDLCARLPYGVKVESVFINPDSKEHKSCGIEVFNATSLLMIRDGLGEFKPYLFPISSMTEEQYDEFEKIVSDDYLENIQITKEMRERVDFITHFPIYCPNVIDWFNKNHFDYRGLIEKSLALDATNLGIYE